MALAGAEGVAPRRVRLTAADRFVLRLALGATLGFAIAMVLDWQFTFLAPMLATQLLAAMPVAPNVRQGVAIPLVVFLATTAALAAASLLIAAPQVLLLLVALVLCWTLYGQRRGAPGLVMLLTQISVCGIAIFAMSSLDLAHTFADFFQKSSVAAIATVWICHALIPAPPPAPQLNGAAVAPAGLPPAYAARIAITDTLVLMPLMANFMLGADTNNLVYIVITLNLLGQVEAARSKRMAVGLLVGNIAGGVMAVVVQQFILVADSFDQFLLTLFLSGLWFGGRMARGGPAAGIFVLAFATYLLLIGIAITPLPGGSGESFVVRIIKIALASLYALGALSLLAPFRRASSA